MTRYHLAQLNIGKLAAPLESPQLAGFVAMLGPVNALADAAPGFVWRLQDADGPGATGIRPCGPGLLVNMSVWETLESLRDFVYRNGPHLDMMRRRREFFQKLNEHYLVLWWVPAGHIPDLDEALARLQLLRRAGPGPAAFTFREPYPPPAEVPGGQRAEPAGQCPAASRREASKITSLQAVRISRGTPGGGLAMRTGRPRAADPDAEHPITRTVLPASAGTERSLPPGRMRFSATTG